MVFGDVFGVSSETWDAFASMSTIVLVALTAWYAWHTRETAKAATDAASQAAASSATAARTADSAVAVADAAERQAMALERDELRKTMPVIHALSAKRVPTPYHGELVMPRAMARNLGPGPALNATLRVFSGQVAGNPVSVQLPIGPGTEVIVGHLPFPFDSPNPDDKIEIEARYQDHFGHEYISRTDTDGRLKTFLVVKGTGGRELLIDPPID